MERAGDETVAAGEWALVTCCKIGSCLFEQLGSVCIEGPGAFASVIASLVRSMTEDGQFTGVLVRLLADADEYGTVRDTADVRVLGGRRTWLAGMNATVVGCSSV